MAFYGHHAAGIPWPGDGLFGLGSDGARAFWIAVRVSFQAVNLGGGRTGRNGHHHASGLQALQASGAGLLVHGSHHAAADFSFLPRPLAQYAPLDSRGGFSFQPSELAKPVLILFLAYFLEARARTMDDIRNTLLPAAAPVLVFLGLIVAQPDLGTAIACAGIAGCILYVAGMRLRYFGYAFGASLLPLYFLIFHVKFRRDRIFAFLNPYADRERAGFHIIQSLIAVGTGGVTGTGLMEGKQKLFYLPEPHTDFIFAVTAEELGLVGAMFVVL